MPGVLHVPVRGNRIIAVGVHEAVLWKFLAGLGAVTASCLVTVGRRTASGDLAQFIAKVRPRDEVSLRAVDGNIVGLKRSAQ